MSKKCPASLWHGPGHQSHTGCTLPEGHEGPHQIVEVVAEWEWSGDACTNIANDWYDLHPITVKR